MLTLVTDRTQAARSVAETVASAVTGGVTAVLLREKDLDRPSLVEMGRAVARVCRPQGVLFVVGHHVDLAVELGADGVHLGWTSVSPEQARALVGEEALVGVSTHDGEELRRAIDGGADYVTYGPVHATPSKAGLVEPCGPDGVAEAVRRAGSVPVVALGGLDAGRAGEIRGTGAAGIAVVRALMQAPDPEVAARDLRRAWEDAA